MKRALLPLAVAAALHALPANAVRLAPEGIGQALIYPYYTVQSVDGNAFNTYLSIVNQAPLSDKALRVRFREARNGREVASFNLYLGSNDVWTGAVVPDGAGARLITADQSCTDPAIGTTGLAFSNAAYTGGFADAGGAGLDRTREGFIEVLEMATLTGTTDRVALAHTAAGVPSNCAALRPTPSGPFAAPTGGLSGTLTLINVASGVDISVNAEALAELATAPYFRPAADPYPGFMAAEIMPVSVVVRGGDTYVSQWTRGIDAVSAVLMRRVSGEYVIDPAVGGRTDVVLTFPTRYGHVRGTTANAPFTRGEWTPGCAQSGGEPYRVLFFSRGQTGAFFNIPSENIAIAVSTLCGAANAIPVKGNPAARSVFGSQAATFDPNGIIVRSTFTDGWLQAQFEQRSLVSLATSTRITPAGDVVTGAHSYSQLPVVGFMARTLSNGFLTCGSGTCLGNYGSAFPFTYTPAVSP